MNFDLNIENYSRNELIEMFELPSNFDKNILEIKESKLKDNIINNVKINKETKVKTINFLTKAKNIILNEHNSNDDKIKNLMDKVYNTNYELQPTKLEENDEHMVQVRPDKVYISSSPSDYFPGIINPLKRKTTRKNLNIDTRFRENYYSSSSTNFNFNLPLNIENVVQMQLNSIELPKSYYAISKQYNNNFFTITVNDSTTLITIPDGNYTESTIMNIINTQLNLAGAPFSFISFIVNLINSETGSGQTLIGSNGSGTVTTIEVNFQADKYGREDRNTPLPLKLGWILGFRNGIYVGNLNYVSEGIVDLTGNKYFYLVVDDYNNSVNNSFISAFNSSILNKNILARISLQGNNFNIIHQNNLGIITTPRDYFGPVKLQTINIQLLDEYGRVVDLNNMDFSFCLTLVTLYDL
jgi:hypothetical protein